MAEKCKTQGMVLNSFPNVVQLPSVTKDGLGGNVSHRVITAINYTDDN